MSDDLVQRCRAVLLERCRWVTDTTTRPFRASVPVDDAAACMARALAFAAERAAINAYADTRTYGDEVIDGALAAAGRDDG